MQMPNQANIDNGRPSSKAELDHFGLASFSAARPHGLIPDIPAANRLMLAGAGVPFGAFLSLANHWTLENTASVELVGILLILGHLIFYFSIFLGLSNVRKHPNLIYGVIATAIGFLGATILTL